MPVECLLTMLCNQADRAVSKQAMFTVDVGQQDQALNHGVTTAWSCDQVSQVTCMGYPLCKGAEGWTLFTQTCNSKIVILSQSIMKNRNVFVTNQSGKCGKEHTNCEKSMLKGQIINAMFSEVEGIQ